MITKRIPLAIAALLVSLTPLAAAQSPAPSSPQGKLVAVVIGVSKYAKLGGGQQLQFADRDALLIADALKKAGVAAENLRVLTGQEATVAAIKSALGNWLARAAGADDTALIFFSGHGFFEQEFGEAYLLAADSDVKEPFATGLSLSDIRQALTVRVHARRVLLITDALRRDFFDSESGSAATAAFLRALDQLVTARAGLSVITASGPGEYSREGQRWNGQGVFTRHLADTLAAGQASDRNHDGWLTADELIEAFAPLVAEDTSNKQHVWHSNTPLAQVTLASLARNASTAAVTAREVQATKSEPLPSVTSGATPTAEITTQPHALTAPTNADKPTGASAKAPEVAATRHDVTAAPQTVGKASTTSPSARPDTQEAKKIDGTTPTGHMPDPAKPESPAITTIKPLPDRVIARAEPLATPPTSKPASAPATSVRAPVAPPPTIASVKADEASAPEVSTVTNPTSAVNLSPPPRPLAALPRLGEVAAESPRRVEAVAPLSPGPASTIEAAPSPLILQLEAAIAAKNLLEPKQTNAWEIYQRLAADPVTASDAARLRPTLAEALTVAGRTIVAGQVYSDSIADRVDDFRRAGQMLARARTLRPDSPEISALEKLSAAQALIALQFYDEAERALSQLQGVKLAAIENAEGLVYQGKLDNFRAERAFKRAVEIDPNWAAPHFNLALLYRAQQNEAALAELEQAAILDSKNAGLLVALGDEYFAKQQWPRAAESYRKAIANKPNDDNLHTKLGHALYSQGLQAEADREYQKARELRSHQQ